MSHARVIVGIAALGLAAFAAAAYARQVPTGDGSAVEVDPGESILPDGITESFYSLADEVAAMNKANAMPTYSGDANVRAFLDVIKRCEGTAGQGDPYRVCYAYRHVVQDLRDHPAVTGEWRGETLTDAQCAGVGLGSGCVSTAAGAYQITRPTWVRLKAKLGLSDFGPVSQDLAAVQLLRDCGAYTALMAGDLDGAVSRARRTWASLPGANYAGQGMRSMGQVVAWFNAAGGATA